MPCGLPDKFSGMLNLLLIRNWTGLLRNWFNCERRSFPPPNALNIGLLIFRHPRFRFQLRQSFLELFPCDELRSVDLFRFYNRLRLSRPFGIVEYPQRLRHTARVCGFSVERVRLAVHQKNALPGRCQKGPCRCFALYPYNRVILLWLRLVLWIIVRKVVVIRHIYSS